MDAQSVADLDAKPAEGNEGLMQAIRAVGIRQPAVACRSIFGKESLVAQMLLIGISRCS